MNPWEWWGRGIVVVLLVVGWLFMVSGAAEAFMNLACKRARLSLYFLAVIGLIAMSIMTIIIIVTLLEQRS